MNFKLVVGKELQPILYVVIAWLQHEHSAIILVNSDLGILMNLPTTG